MENWKDIKGYEGIYQVSDLGRVRSLDRTFKDRSGRVQKIKGKIRAQKSTNGRGYIQLSLSDGKNKSRQTLHRIVATAFIENPSGKPEINHIDGDKSNNMANNLEWCTRSENVRHCFKLGLRSSVGENNGRSNINEDDVREIFRLKKAKTSVYEIAELMSVKRTLIYDVLSRRCWKHVEI
jgi:hypothetical protein